MAGRLNFKWNKAPVMRHVERGSRDTMVELGTVGKSFWQVIVPILSGTLRRRYFYRIEKRGERIFLVFGGATRYAIYVELGTRLMRPRAPIRTLAGELAPLVLPTLARKLRGR